MTPELRRLETEIFYDRKLRRIGAIREAWAAYMDALEEPKLSTWEKFWAVVDDLIGPLGKKQGYK